PGWAPPRRPRAGSRAPEGPRTPEAGERAGFSLRSRRAEPAAGRLEPPGRLPLLPPGSAPAAPAGILLRRRREHRGGRGLFGHGPGRRAHPLLDAARGPPGLQPDPPAARLDPLPEERAPGGRGAAADL